jgi:hypothetical protein
MNRALLVQDQTEPLSDFVCRTPNGLDKTRGQGMVRANEPSRLGSIPKRRTCLKSKQLVAQSGRATCANTSVAGSNPVQSSAVQT